MHNEKYHHTSPFLLNEALIDPGSHSVTKNGAQIRIEPRLIELLLRLKQNEGEVVTRDALIQDVWGSNSGSDEALTQAVSRLRRALDLSHDSGAKIETIPKLGYRLTNADHIASAPITNQPRRFKPSQTHLIWAAIFGMLVFILYTNANRPELELKHIEIILEE